MSTSKRISLYFTFFATTLLLIFTILINFSFFGEWYNHENKKLQTVVNNISKTQNQDNRLGETGRQKPGGRLLGGNFTQTVTLPYTGELKTYIQERRRRNIIQNEDERYIFAVNNKDIVLSRITPLIERQRALALMSLAGLVIFALLSYIFSHRFARKGLSNLHKLADHVGEIHIDKLHQKILFPDLPNNDEIKIVANEINIMQEALDGQVNQIKSFISNVSHEFKTPLMVIQSSIELAQVTKDHEKALTTTQSQVTKLHKLLETLIQLQNPEGIKPQKPYNPEKDIQDIYTHISQIYHKNHIFKLDMHPGMSINYPVTALHIILQNIIENAVKYTPVEGIIHIHSSQDKTHTYIYIDDSGPGISQEDLEHIREPFRQGDTSRHIDQGFGLGLSIVKSIIDKYGGAIEYHTSPLGGTRVIISISTYDET